MRLFLTLQILLFSLFSHASISITSNLNLGDSARMYNSLLSLGRTIEQDANDLDLFLHKTQFSSADGAFTIECTKQIKSFELGTNCTVEADSEKSVEGVTSVTTGAVGNVTVVNFSNIDDIRSLSKSVTQLLGYFQSSENVQVMLPNGNQVEAPKFRVECNSKAATKQTCQATLF